MDDICAFEKHISRHDTTINMLYSTVYTIPCTIPYHIMSTGSVLKDNQSFTLYPEIRIQMNEKTDGTNFFKGASSIGSLPERWQCWGWWRRCRRPPPWAPWWPGCRSSRTPPPARWTGRQNQGSAPVGKTHMWNHRCIGGFKKPTRGVSGPILLGVEEQVNKGA